MKKKTLLSRIAVSRGGAIAAALSLFVQMLSPSLAIAANELGSYDEFHLSVNVPEIVYNSGDGTFDVALTGSGVASPFTWSSLGYYVRVTWGDGDVALSDTPSSGAMDTFHTPDYGQTLTGDWSGEHTFTGAGTYNMIVEWFYNPNQPHTTPVKVPADSDLDNDGVRARVTVPIVLEVPTQPTSDGVTLCVDDSGYHATLSGSATLSPFTWSSLGYYMRLNWDNGNTAYSDTPGSGVTDTFHTPDYGQTLTGNWTATTTFSAEGEYSVVADLFYNPNQPHTTPVKVPGNSDLGNDVLKNTQTIHVNTSDAVPCNPPPAPAPEPELPLDLSVSTMDVCRAGDGYEVSLAGVGGGSPFTWSSLGYYVHVNWDDSSTDNSDTPGSNATDGFYTPDYGGTLAGAWNAEHAYTTGGDYNVVVDLFYNPNQPHTTPVKVPAASNPGNDQRVATALVELSLSGDVPDCVGNPQGSANLTIQKVWESILPVENRPSISIWFNSGLVQLDPETLSWNTNVMPGQHALSEDAVPGFTTDINCGTAYYDAQSHQLNLENNDNITCTITNTQILATSTVTIIKDWDLLNEDATSTVPTFEISFDGNVVLSSATTGTSPVVITDVVEGSHTIIEGAVAGFSSSIVCAQDNGEGSTNLPIENDTFSFSGSNEVTCTVTNTETEETDGGDGGGSVINSLSGQSSGGGGGSGGIPSPNAVGGGPSGFLTVVPQVLGIQDTAETILTCGEQYPTAALITGELDDLLATYGFARDLPREKGLGQTILSKIVPAGITLTQQQIITNFIVYGIEALLHLGEGERAGLVASFERIYGSYPENECDWQNVIRIGEGVVPVVLVPERETDAETAFAEIYDRAADRAVEQDNVTVLIMAYGLRPDVRSIAAEIQAGAIFRSVFGHFPGNTGEWDVMRGIAYGGITVPGFAPITR